MKRTKFELAFASLLLLAAPGVARGQDQPPPPPPEAAPAAYTEPQLDQMLAPIALYPDQLLMQILMASTYPGQLANAGRWLRDPAHAALKGDALVAALQPLPWDPSVKSLVAFPQIVAMLNERQDWTNSLGNAFANQQTDVMARVQFLRQQARNAGNLASSPQLNVRQQGQTIAIQPANPNVVYVPVYNPATIYGPWPYVAYPPFYWAPRRDFFLGTVGLGLGFSIGFGIVGPLWGWGHWDWGGRHLFIDGAGYRAIAFNHRAYAGGTTWHHQGPVGRGAAHAAGGPGHAGAVGATRGVGAARTAAHPAAARPKAGGGHAHAGGHARGHAGGHGEKK